MTLAEQREKLSFNLAIALAEWAGDLRKRSFDEFPPYLQGMYLSGSEAILVAIAAAGFTLCGPEVTDEMNAVWDNGRDKEQIFKAMAATGDLARMAEKDTKE